MSESRFDWDGLIRFAMPNHQCLQKSTVLLVQVGCSIPNTPVAESQWRKTRVDRMLVEHFLRTGYYDSAMGLAKQANIEDLTNINLFLVAKEVEDALKQKDVTKCLAWCHDNKSKLRKMKSNLEYNVRLQGEFGEVSLCLLHMTSRNHHLT